VPPAAPIARPATFAIAAGAALGTGARALVGLALPLGAAGWAWPTLAVNLLGSFALGAAFGRADRGRGPAWLRGPGFTTGVLGSFTTFSALAVEAGRLALPIGTGYLAASLVGGLLAAALGWRAGRGRP
jgi:CrcB protein